MEKYIKINGNKILSGKITISGAKNSVLALIFATILTDEVVIIEDVPDISDVYKAINLMKYLGSNIIVSTQGKRKVLTIDNKDLIYKDLLIDEVTEFRASYYLMGAMISRFGKVKLFLPGGCFLGPRPIDLHIKGFEALGCIVNEYEDNAKTIIEISSSGELKSERIFLDFPSVGATMNIILAAVLIGGETVIENVAKEPEIVDLLTLLNTMGAKIKGGGTSEVTIRGVEKLHGGFHQVVPDRIEAGTYLMIGSLLGKDFTVDNVIPEHIEALTSKLIEIGVDLKIENDKITIYGYNEILKQVNIKVGVYPSFATDLQQVMATLLTQVVGESTITETIYPDRHRNTKYLNEMGSNIEIEQETGQCKIIIKGVTELKGREVVATDLRGGASMVFAGLLAEGETKVTEIEHLLRGYENLVEKLRGVGADIEIIEE